MLIKRFLYYLTLYIFLYNPPLRVLRGVNLAYVLTIVAFFVMLRNFTSLKRFFATFRYEILIFSAVLLFVIVRSAGIGQNLIIIRHLLGVSKFLVLIPFMLYFARKMGMYSEKELIRSLLIVSAIAGCFSMLCAYYPDFDNYVRNQLMNYEEDDYGMRATYRAFGIASALTGYYGYIQGTLAAVGLLYIKQNKWFILFLPIVYFSALVNARTGVLISIWGIAVFMMSRNSKYVYPVAGLLIFLVVSPTSFMKFFNLNENTVAWILDFQDQLGDMEDARILKTLFQNMMVLPETTSEWIIGKGLSVFRMEYGEAHSDVGWFIQLCYGGIIYLIILYSIIVYMSIRLASKHYFLFMYFLVGTFAIINTKSSFYPGNGAFSLLLFLYCIYILKSTYVKGKALLV